MIFRINQYRAMWVFVHFDLPTQTKTQRKAYTEFRKNLLEDGYGMIQFSIYARHCSSKENADVHKRRVKRYLPKHGNVVIFQITDRQFGMMEFFNGKASVVLPDTPSQLEMF